MTNDELIRQVATTIKQHVFNATMEEALDAAKEIVRVSEQRIDRYRAYTDFRMMVSTLLLDWPENPELTIDQVFQSIVSLNMKYRAFVDGEDYITLSTEPQIVTEIIEPEVVNAPTTEKEEATGTEAGQ